MSICLRTSWSSELEEVVWAEDNEFLELIIESSSGVAWSKDNDVLELIIKSSSAYFSWSIGKIDKGECAIEESF